MFAECRQDFVDEIFETGERVFARRCPEAVGLFAPEIFRQVGENLFVDRVEFVQFGFGPTVVACLGWWLAVFFVEVPLAADGLVAGFWIH